MSQRAPWTFSAVCVMIVGIVLLIHGLPQVSSAFQLLPGYVAAYLLIGACIFGPAGKPTLRQGVAFLLPGVLLVVLALLDLGFWAGGWMLGLPSWGLLLSRWTPENPLRGLQLLKFLGLLVLGLAIFVFNVIYPILSLGLFLLPFIPLMRLAFPDYRARPLQAAAEILLGVATVVIAFAVPTPEGAWSSPWTHAGGAATVGLMIAFWARGVTSPSPRPQFGNGVVV